MSEEAGVSSNGSPGPSSSNGSSNEAEDPFLSCGPNQVRLEAGICLACPQIIPGDGSEANDAFLHEAPFGPFSNNYDEGRFNFETSDSHIDKSYCGTQSHIRKATIYGMCYGSQQPQYRNLYRYSTIGSPPVCLGIGKSVPNASSGNWGRSYNRNYPSASTSSSNANSSSSPSSSYPSSSSPSSRPPGRPSVSSRSSSIQQVQPSSRPIVQPSIRPHVQANPSVQMRRSNTNNINNIMNRTVPPVNRTVPPVTRSQTGSSNRRS